MNKRQGYFLFIIAFGSKEFDRIIVILFSLLLIFAFWYLDDFFINTERICKLYEWALVEKNNGNDENLYQLNAKKF